MYRLRKIPYPNINLSGTLFYFEQGLLEHFISRTIDDAEHLLLNLIEEKRVTFVNTEYFQVLNHEGEVIRTYDAQQLSEIYNNRIDNEANTN